MIPSRVLAAALVLVAARLDAQWTRVNTGTTASLRGLTSGPGRIVWASGQHGTVLQSADLGVTWTVMTIPGAESFDLRGIIPIGNAMLAMVSGADTARIYRTVDSGRTWTIAYDDRRKGAFLDGMARWSGGRGIAVGDPIDGRWVILVTDDAGAHWRPVADPPAALAGEAAFAASNSCVVTGSRGRAWIVTGGGPVARVLRTTDYGQHWSAAELPIPAGNAASGAFSAAIDPGGAFGVVVGGDYAVPDSARLNVAVMTDGGRQWVAGDTARRAPYLSSVTGDAVLVATGPRGTYTSPDWGRSWSRVDTVGYNAVIVTAPGRFVAVGPNGTVGISGRRR